MTYFNEEAMISSGEYVFLLDFSLHIRFNHIFIRQQFASFNDTNFILLFQIKNRW